MVSCNLVDSISVVLHIMYGDCSKLTYRINVAFVINKIITIVFTLIWLCVVYVRVI